jgi:hypothetical protein
LATNAAREPRRPRRPAPSRTHDFNRKPGFTIGGKKRITTPEHLSSGECLVPDRSVRAARGTADGRRARAGRGRRNGGIRNERAQHEPKARTHSNDDVSGEREVWLIQAIRARRRSRASATAQDPSRPVLAANADRRHHRRSTSRARDVMDPAVNRRARPRRTAPSVRERSVRSAGKTAAPRRSSPADRA